MTLITRTDGLSLLDPRLSRRRALGGMIFAGYAAAALAADAAPIVTDSFGMPTANCRPIWRGPTALDGARP
jgi:hypothetical protein